MPCADRLLAEKAVGNLDQDAGAIARQRIRTHRAAVREVLENLQALLDDGMALAILDVGDKADAASVVFVGGVVKTLARGEVHLVFPQQVAAYTAM